MRWTECAYFCVAVLRRTALLTRRTATQSWEVDDFILEWLPLVPRGPVPLTGNSGWHFSPRPDSSRG